VRKARTERPPTGAVRRGSGQESPALPRLVKEGPRSSGASSTQPGYKPPRIRVVSGGLPGLGKRR
jgi:hypothetical protein